MLLYYFIRNLKSKFNIDRKKAGTVLLFVCIFSFCIIYTVQVFRCFATGNDISFGSVLSFTLHDGIPIGVFGVLLFVYLIMFLAFYWQWRVKPRKNELHNYFMPKTLAGQKSETYGSAEFESIKSLEDAGEAIFTTVAKSEGIIYGRMDKDSNRHCITRTINRQSNYHTCVFGASGSGKTYSVVKPAICQLCRSRESIILTDPKGELYADTASYLRDNGYVIKRLDFVHLFLSDQWDCISEIADPKYDEAQKIDRAQIFASIVMDNLSNPGNDFYEAQLSLLKALILRVVFGNDYGDNPGCKPRSFGSCYNILVDLTKPLSAYFDTNINPEIAPAMDAYGAFCRASERAYGNIVSGLASLLGVLQSSAVKHILSSSGNPEYDIDPVLPGQKPCAYFLIMSDMHGAYEFLSSLFFSFLFLDLAEYADDLDTGRLEVPVNFLLDEFANIGEIPDFPKKMATIRSRDMKVMIILQNITQLQERYETNWVSILANCYTILSIGINDDPTADYFRSRIGEATIQVQTQRHDENESVFDLSHKKSVGEGKRSLLTNDEIQRMGKDEVLIIFQRRNPLLAYKFPISDHPDFKKLKRTNVKKIVPSIMDVEKRLEYYEAEKRRVEEYEERLRNGYVPENQQIEDDEEEKAVGTISKIKEAFIETLEEYRNSKPVYTPGKDDPSKKRIPFKKKKAYSVDSDGVIDVGAAQNVVDENEGVIDLGSDAEIFEEIYDVDEVHVYSDENYFSEQETSAAVPEPSQDAAEEKPDPKAKQNRSSEPQTATAKKGKSPSNSSASKKKSSTAEKKPTASRKEKPTTSEKDPPARANNDDGSPSESCAAQHDNKTPAVMPPSLSFRQSMDGKQPKKTSTAQKAQKSKHDDNLPAVQETQKSKQSIPPSSQSEGASANTAPQQKTPMPSAGTKSPFAGAKAKTETAEDAGCDEAAERTMNENLDYLIGLSTTHD